MSEIRTFVATPLIEMESLKSWVSDLKKVSMSGKIKWNPPELWHLTFKFIGNMDASQLKPLVESLRKALDGCQPGTIKLEGAGYFGSSKAPGVIWAGIRENEWLLEVMKRIENGVSELELPQDNRPFRPHLTLARVKYLKDSSHLLEAFKEKKDYIWGDFRVNRIVLYKSRLTAEGPVYSELESFELLDSL
ncbi:RNA 2',3'-cyclic phosphodiesterase [Marinilabilia sp.]